ncbi:cupredoxin domain-containing protein [Flocculibacter collagenilyticus]|uniref:hypothetical protein n=1 Tax=Flocculibacter collagenilyticus TaxID=2744479 RepID=UPI0018F4E1F6|nr:hypothetical protein [Flocculibacter collagenilyticus]
MKKKVALITSTLFAVSMSATVNAATLTGTLEFTKKPAFTGLLYAKGGSGPKSDVMDQSNKVFDKKMLVVGPNGKINFKNSDTFQHNIFANDPKNNVKFDIGLMEPGQANIVKVDWQENTVTRIGCKIHPKMRSYIANVNAEHYLILPLEKGKKSYDINLDVGGSTTFVLSLPKYDPLEVTLAAGESKTVDVTKKGKKRASLTLALK